MTVKNEVRHVKLNGGLYNGVVYDLEKDKITPTLGIKSKSIKGIEYMEEDYLAVYVFTHIDADFNYNYTIKDCQSQMFCCNHLRR